MILENKVCRICGSPTVEVLNFGEIYVSDFIRNSYSHDKLKAPLVLDQCVSCSLVQLRHTVDANILYRKYWYKSGCNPVIYDNLRTIADSVNSMTVPGDVIVDIGANDGSLLKNIKTDRIRIGCEPADVFLDSLHRTCDVVIHDFWGPGLMNKTKANVITAIGMLYDLDDPNMFVKGVADNLAEGGTFISQFMPLSLMLAMNDIGNICHEHLEYYTYKSLRILFERNGLEIFKVVTNDIQGGSYQIWARHFKHGSIDFYENPIDFGAFRKRIETNKIELNDILTEFKKAGKRLYVYGASTKGNTILQIYNIGKYFLGAAEIHEDKIGRYTIGSNLLISHESHIREKADVFFVPNFGFNNFFAEKEADWIKAGGKMIFAMPYVKVIE